MKMTPIKLASAFTLLFTFAANASAIVSIEKTGSYGSYLKSGCYWSTFSDRNYGGGSTVINVKQEMLWCTGYNPPQAVKTTETYYVNGQHTNTNCFLQEGDATIEGNCASHHIYQD